MAKKPTYEELERKLEHLESELTKYKEQKRISDQEILEDFRSLADRSQDAIYHYDLISRKFSFVNKIFLALYGFTEEDGRVPTTKSTLLHIYPEDREKVKKGQKDSLAPGCKSGEVEYRFFHADGTIHWMHDKWNVIRDMSGKPIAIEGIVRDDTERKRAEETLRENEERFRRLFDTMAEGVVLIALDGQIVQANLSAERILGLKRSEIESHNFMSPDWEIIGSDGSPMPPEEMAGSRAMKEKRLVKDVIMGVKRPDVPISWINVSASPLIGQTGDLEGVVSTFADITELKQVEKMLRESELWLQNIYNALEEAVLVVSPDRRILNINEATRKMFGYSKEEIEDLSTEVFHVDHDHYVEFGRRFKEAFDNDQTANFEFKVKRKNGEIFPTAHTVSLLKNEQGDGIGIVSVVRDITERKKAEEELKLREKKLQQQNSISQGINKVFREAILCKNPEEVALACLSVAEELTGSKFGFIGEVNQRGCFDTIALSDPGWEECQMPESNAAEMISDMEIRGIWGRVIKDGKSLIVNDPGSHPDSVGTPGNHPVVSKFLGVPLKQADRCIGMIALANKKSGYSSDDQESIEALSVAFTEALHRKRSEAALGESEEKYRSLVESTEDIIYLVDPDLRYLFANEKYRLRLGLPMDKIIHSNYKASHSKKGTKDFAEKVHEVFETGRSLLYEYKSDRDGRYFIRTLSPVKDQSGRTTSVTVISKDITEWKMTEEALNRSREKLLKEYNERKILSKRLIDLLEKDRNEIAMELHDHIGQTLTSLKMNLEMIRGQIKPVDTELESQISDAEKKAIQALKDIRSVSHGLRPPVIDTLGLVSSLRELFNETQHHTDFEIQFFSRGIPERLEAGKELAIYRIVQEALTNIIKHARARNVFVNMVKKDEKLSLSVEDDGVGFDLEKAMKATIRKGPLGLLIMRERAEQLGGDFTVESQIGKGTQLLVEIPV